MAASGHEAITVGITAVGPTAATALNAVTAYITTETSDIRIRYDGTAPTATTGHKIAAGTSFTLTGGADIANLLMIRDTAAASDATVRVTYGKG